jgi:hypothetical protein
VIELRDFVSGDAAWLDSWLPNLAQIVAYDTCTSSKLLSRIDGESELRVRTIVRDGNAVGLVVWRLLSTSQALFEFVATPRAHARRGAGMIAAALVEKEMLGLGVQEVFAPAAELHGISMYFWVRLGYAPLLRPDWPCEREGVAWLRRIVR